MKKIMFPMFVCLVVFSTGCTKKSSDTTTTGTNCTWTTVFSDDFNRANGPLGANYKDTIVSVFGGSGSGFADILDGSLRVSTNTCFWAIWYVPDVDGSRVRISAKCTMPATGGPMNFGVGGKNSLPGQQSQTGYFGGVNLDTLQLFRIAGINTQRFSAKYFKIQAGHTYKVMLTIDDAALIVTLTDLSTDETASISATDPSPLSGKSYTMNGNTIGGSAVLLFDDFLIERCQ